MTYRTTAPKPDPVIAYLGGRRSYLGGRRTDASDIREYLGGRRP
jgi:hypothetical protein